MRTNTQRIFERLSRGAFITVDSSDTDVRYLYNDLEENREEYGSYFEELGLRLDGGDGYFYFSRISESKQNMEKKLQTFAQWIDILDFLKTFDNTFSVGRQFRSSKILENINLDVELRDKSRKLFRKQKNHAEIVQKLLDELTAKGYAERINEEDGTYKVTSAFRYLEELVNLITIYNEEELTES